jgi:hypothetical protein
MAVAAAVAEVALPDRVEGARRGTCGTGRAGGTLRERQVAVLAAVVVLEAALGRKRRRPFGLDAAHARQLQ